MEVPVKGSFTAPVIRSSVWSSILDWRFESSAAPLRAAAGDSSHLKAKKNRPNSSMPTVMAPNKCSTISSKAEKHRSSGFKFYSQIPVVEGCRDCAPGTLTISISKSELLGTQTRNIHCCPEAQNQKTCGWPLGSQVLSKDVRTGATTETPNPPYA